MIAAPSNTRPRARAITAAVRAVEQSTGRKVARVEIEPDGRIVVELEPQQSVKTNDPAPPTPTPSEWDEVPDYYGKRK